MLRGRSKRAMPLAFRAKKCIIGKRDRVVVNRREQMGKLRARFRFDLFDKNGLDPDTIKNLQLLIISVMGGVIWSNITNGVAMAGYMKDLHASDFLYGAVFSLLPVFNAFQFFASYRMERTLKRKRMFLVSGFIQRLIWLPFAFIPFILPMEQAQLRLAAAVLCIAVSAGAAPFMNVSFYSLCADVVPMRIRGRYFATRSRISTLAGMMVGLLVGLLLDSIPGFAGYCVVFCIAAVAGTLDVSCFLLMPMPEMRATPEKTGMFKMLRHVVTDRHYMPLVLSMTVWNFSVQSASPYFNVYMRDFLGLPNMTIMLIGQIANNVFLILFVNKWGRAMDTFGNKAVLCVAAFLTSFMPLIAAMPGESTIVWLLLANCLSGATYCAIDLSAQNLFMGQAREGNKSMYFAVYFLFTQLLGLALGSTVGGFLLDNVFAPLEALGATVFGAPMSRYNYLFVFSFILRLATVLFLLTRVRETEGQPVSALTRRIAGFLPHAYNVWRIHILRRRAYREDAARRQTPHDAD